ncbi:MAG: hypothetical protein IT294_11545 [Deltaproteobacteria bacterium]|nr:hypothetical protein [Deltaproteobacteria bacterium]
MNRLREAAAALALVAISVGPASAQVEKSRIDIPFFLEGPAAELAAKMLFICGGGSGATAPVRYTVTVKHAPPATPLTLSAGGIPQATVVTSASGNARFKFGANGAPGTPLDFDPRNREIEIKDDDGDTLASSQEPGGTTPVGSKIDERVSLNATGAIPAASGHARLREKKGIRDFDVEVEDVPNGAYDLVVGGVVRGTITVVGGQGDIEFSNGGDDPDELPLDFDPLGAVVQVMQGSAVVLSGTMLAGATGVSVCDPRESTTALSSTGADPDGSGDVRVRVKDDCDRDFQVEIEDVPAGAYDVVVGGVVRGTLLVVDVAGETEGELEFDTDADDPDELPLDFDPEGQTVEVRQGATVFFTGTVGAAASGTCGEVFDEPDLVNVGPDPDADGKARFRQESDCDRDFRVEAEDLPLGGYEVVVGGVVRGPLTVVDLGGGDIEGELELDDDPDEPGELLLDFDPRGLLVEVRQGGTVFLSVTMAD